MSECFSRRSMMGNRPISFTMSSLTASLPEVWSRGEEGGGEGKKVNGEGRGGRREPGEGRGNGRKERGR
jgi:hypothetical protein